MALVQPLKDVMNKDVMYHLALEALTKLDKEDVMSDAGEIAAADRRA